MLLTQVAQHFLILSRSMSLEERGSVSCEIFYIMMGIGVVLCAVVAMLPTSSAAEIALILEDHEESAGVPSIFENYASVVYILKAVQFA